MLAMPTCSRVTVLARNVRRGCPGRRRPARCPGPARCPPGPAPPPAGLRSFLDRRGGRPAVEDHGRSSGASRRQPRRLPGCSWNPSPDMRQSDSRDRHRAPPRDRHRPGPSRSPAPRPTTCRWQTRWSVEEVTGAGEVQGDARVLPRPAPPRRRGRTRRAQRWHSPRRSEHLKAVGEGKKASLAATAPMARSLLRVTASRAASTRLTCPMPTPTVAPAGGDQDGVGLHAAAGAPREGQVGHDLAGGLAGRPSVPSWPGRRRARRAGPRTA